MSDRRPACLDGLGPREGREWARPPPIFPILAIYGNSRRRRVPGRVHGPSLAKARRSTWAGGPLLAVGRRRTTTLIPAATLTLGVGPPPHGGGRPGRELFRAGTRCPRALPGEPRHDKGRDARVSGLGWALGHAPAIRRSSRRPEPPLCLGLSSRRAQSAGGAREGLSSKYIEDARRLYEERMKTSSSILARE